MAKIAVDLERALSRRAVNGTAGDLAWRKVARGDGWTVADVICTSGPEDRSFEEQHRHVSIGLVAAGTFQYRSPTGRALMAPGSLLLGNAGELFECGHDHAAGDRCIAFHYTPDYFERIAADAGAPVGGSGLRVPRLPPSRALAPLVSYACAGLLAITDAPWEELGIELAALVVRLAAGQPLHSSTGPRGAESRVTRIVRAIERDPGVGGLDLRSLAREARLSPYHFLRAFQSVTGVTPHQYVLRTRLREAVLRLASERAKVIDVAFGCGFGDLSNFNRAFRTEFGVSPRAYRSRWAADQISFLGSSTNC